MDKTIIAGIEVSFDDLSEDLQTRLYEKDSKKFIKDVATSQYSFVRQLVIRDKRTSGNILDKVFKVETELYGVVSNISDVWKHPNFKKDDTKIRVLIESDSFEIRYFVAESQDLSSELLNEMLQHEIQNTQNEYIIDAIIDNKNFKMNDETRRALVDTGFYKYIVIAAEDKGTSSEFLNEILKKEIDEKNDEDVILAVICNPNFIMKEDFQMVLMCNDNDTVRVKVAQYEKNDSEFLNRMLQHEVKGEQEEDVEKAIVNNHNFKMNDETRKLLANDKYYGYRLMAVEDEGTSIELLNTMYFKEENSLVLHAIEERMIKMDIDHSITLNSIQKIKILEVLKNLKYSRKKLPLTEYLEMIVRILE